MKAQRWSRVDVRRASTDSRRLLLRRHQRQRVLAGRLDGRSDGLPDGTPSASAAKYNLPSHFIGGSHLEAAQPGKVKDFVAAHGGHTVITNVRASIEHPHCSDF